MLFLKCIVTNLPAVFNSNTTDTRSSLPVAGDAVAEEGAGTSLTSCEDVTQGSLRSRRTTRIRDTPLSKSGLEGNDLLEKTRERDRLETKAEYHLSQVQVFCFTFVLVL